jgi:hypothetical protein
MAEIPAICSMTIARAPSCVEFLPSDTTYAFIGTYALESDNDGDGPKILEGAEPMAPPQKRNGSIVILRVNDDTLLVTRSFNSGILTSMQINSQRISAKLRNIGFAFIARVRHLGHRQLHRITDVWGLRTI